MKKILNKIIKRGKVREGGVKIAGHWFYLIEPEQMVYQRYVALLVAFKETDLGLTRADLIKFCEMTRNALNKGDVSTAGYLSTQLEAFAESYCEKKNLLRLVNPMILIDDEPEDSMSPEHTKIKQNLCEESEEVEFFFIKVAMNFFQKMNGSTEDMSNTDYSKTSHLHNLEENFLRSLHTSIYKGW